LDQPMRIAFYSSEEQDIVARGYFLK
jgi:hypothetical protein